MKRLPQTLTKLIVKICDCLFFCKVFNKMT